MPEHNDDIGKYLDGELSPDERHRLEKRALSDPFLAEAMEGAEMLSGAEFSNDLNEIHQKITAQKRSSLFLPLRIAAGILVMASIIVATIQFIENDASNQLALQKQSSPVEHVPAPNKSPVPNSKERNEPVAGQQAPARESRRRVPNQFAISEKPQAPPIEEPMSRADALSPSPAQPELMDESEITRDMRNEEIARQKSESFKAQESEDKKELSPSKNDRASVAPTATRSLALSKKTEAASGAGSAKDEADAAITAREPVAAESMILFSNYVKDNLRYPQRALNRNVQGDVIIEFLVNADGSYRNFKVVKSLGFGCDEEAIRLIKEGPKWNPAIEDGKVIDTKQHVTIPFQTNRKPTNSP